MSVKQISVFLENKPGMMNNMTEVLAKNKIDMRALSLAETSEFGIVRIIVDDVYAATTVLKDEGYVHNVTDVLGVAIPDEPGGLNHVVQILAAAGINVEYMYAFLGGKEVEHAYMIFKVENVKDAISALAAEHIQSLTQEDIAKL